MGQDYIPTLIGTDKDFLSTRISYKLNLRGPSLTVQTACSTSLVAVHLARQSLLVVTKPTWPWPAVFRCVFPIAAGYFHDAGGVTSSDGRVRAFDAKANGTVFGSGGGILVLKRLADALADGDFIHAIIKGSAVNNDGAEKAGYTAPSVNGQADAVVEALANAGVDAESISYVEAHGSGTPVGDPIEIRALTQGIPRIHATLAILRHWLSQDQSRPSGCGGGSGRDHQDGSCAEESGSSPPALTTVTRIRRSIFRILLSM